MIVSHLLDPKLLVTLDKAKMRSISAALQAELIKDPEIMKVLEKRVEPYAAALDKRS